MTVGARMIVGRTTVTAENEGDMIDQSKSDPAAFRVHVKAVNPMS
jgi:hypothetical protein